MALVAFTSIANAREKHALIIANADYEHGGSLRNPPRDADLIREKLEAADFVVTVRENLTLSEMRRAVSEFGLQQSETDNVALVYYSGHGAEFAGANYLIPVDARLEDAREARHEALTLRDVENFLHRPISDADRAAGRHVKGLNIIVLDACRNNPYPSQTRSVPRGLGPVDGATGTLIWYATQPRERADDGDGSFSPFATAFAESIERASGEAVEQTFKRIASRTLELTEGRQQPWQSGFVMGDFTFRGGILPEKNIEIRHLKEFAPLTLEQELARPLPPPPAPVEYIFERIGAWNIGYVFEPSLFIRALSIKGAYQKIDINGTTVIVRLRAFGHLRGQMDIFISKKYRNLPELKVNSELSPKEDLCYPNILFWCRNAPICTDIGCHISEVLGDYVEYRANVWPIDHLPLEVHLDIGDGSGFHEIDIDGITEIFQRIDSDKRAYLMSNYICIPSNEDCAEPESHEEAERRLVQYMSYWKNDMRDPYWRRCYEIPVYSQYTKRQFFNSDNEYENELHRMFREIVRTPLDERIDFAGNHKAYPCNHQILKWISVSFTNAPRNFAEGNFQGLIFRTDFSLGFHDYSIHDPVFVEYSYLHGTLGYIPLEFSLRNVAVNLFTQYLKLVEIDNQRLIGAFSEFERVGRSEESINLWGDLYSSEKIMSSYSLIKRKLRALLQNAIDVSNARSIDARSEMAWQEVQKEERGLAERVATTREYITLFPESENIAEAQDLLVELSQKMSTCGNAAPIWRLLSASTDASLLHKFIEQYADCPEASMARDRIGAQSTLSQP